MTAWATLRFCAALWLVFYLVHTPIHLYLEPHSEGADCRSAPASTRTTPAWADAGQDGHGHHERHPADQHQFKGVRSERLVLGQMFLVPALEWMEAQTDRPQPRLFGFSGLSPPELCRCWQFLFRAALFVRAPTLHS